MKAAGIERIKSVNELCLADSSSSEGRNRMKEKPDIVWNDNIAVSEELGLVKSVLKPVRQLVEPLDVELNGLPADVVCDLRDLPSQHSVAICHSLFRL